MPRDNPATAVAACAGCAASWRGSERAHCRVCHATFDDEVLFDAHRLTGSCVPPERLDLVAVGVVWCRLLSGQQRAAAWPVRTGQRPNVIRSLIGSGTETPFSGCTHPVVVPSGGADLHVGKPRSVRIYRFGLDQVRSCEERVCGSV